MNKYRCETCKHFLRYVLHCKKNGLHLPEESVVKIYNVGCASHSDFNPQAEREKYKLCKYLRCSTNKMNCPKPRSDLTKTRITDFCYSCATHSSATTNQELKSTNLVVDQRSEREKVLDELKRWADGQILYHDFDGFADIYVDIKDKIEELRKGGE